MTSRAEFIRYTVGAEIHRACVYVGRGATMTVYDAFLSADVTDWARVYLYWWSGSTFLFGDRYDLSLTIIRRIGPTEESEYVPNGKLPEPNDDLSLLVVGYPADIEDTGLPEHDKPDDIVCALYAKDAFVAASWGTDHLEDPRLVSIKTVPLTQFDTSVNAALTLAKLALNLGEIPRATLHPDKVTSESVATHTVMVGYVACQLAYHAGLDVGRVAELCLIHDTVEAVLGSDTSTLQISDADRAAKMEREHAAVLRIYREFRLSAPWLCARLREYEERTSPEAAIVDIADKVTPKLTQALNEGESVIRHGISSAEYAASQARQLKKMRLRYGGDDRLAGALEMLRASIDTAVSAVQTAEGQTRLTTPEQCSVPRDLVEDLQAFTRSETHDAHEAERLSQALARILGQDLPAADPKQHNLPLPLVNPMDSSVNSQRMWDRIELLKGNEVALEAHRDGQPLPAGVYVLLCTDSVMAAENWATMVYHVDGAGTIQHSFNDSPPQTIHRRLYPCSTSAELVALDNGDRTPDEHGTSRSLFRAPPNILDVKWEACAD